MSNRYIITFTFILTAVVALSLTLLRQATEPLAKKNEELFKKAAILSAVADHLPEGKSLNTLSGDEVLSLFKETVETVVVNAQGQVVDGIDGEKINVAKEWKKPAEQRQMPVFIYRHGDKVCYIFPLRGKGLWDEIWGYIALDADLNTILGISFDHKAETPGLGAEIKDNPNFARAFVGKKIFDTRGQFVSVVLKKGGAAPDDEHAVDGITGATLTSDGVSDMLKEGLAWYLPYIEAVKKGK